jgi:hypothetical protein
MLFAILSQQNGRSAAKLQKRFLLLKAPKRQIHHFLFSVIIVQSMRLHKKIVNNNCVRWCYSADPCHLETIPELSLR